jgi:hypothetical protein
VQITGATGGFEVQLDLLDLALHRGGALQRSFLRRPDFLEVGKLALGVLYLFVQQRQLLGRGFILVLLDRLALDLELNEAPLEPIHGLGLGVDFHADAACRLVHQVDGLVRQLAVGDVALRQPRRGDDRRVGDIHPVVHLVALFQSTEDRDRVFLAGLVNQYFLEAPLQRRVLFDVLAVLVQRGGADAVQLAAGQGRLEHVARIHGALGLAGADHGVNLVDEQDDPALLLGELVENRLESLLEITAKLRAGEQCTQVQRQDALVPQPLGTSPLITRWARPSTIAVLPTPGSPMSTGLFLVRRCSTWIVRRISSSRPITGSSLPSRARSVRSMVYFSSACRDSSASALLTASPPRTAATAALRPAGCYAAVRERLGHGTTGLEECLQHDLAGDEAVATLLGLAVTEVEYPAQIRRHVDLTGGVGYHRQRLDDTAQRLLQRVEVGAGTLQQRAGRAALLIQQRLQQMRRIDLVVILDPRPGTVHPPGRSAVSS